MFNFFLLVLFFSDCFHPSNWFSSFFSFSNFDNFPFSSSGFSFEFSKHRHRQKEKNPCDSFLPFFRIFWCVLVELLPLLFPPIQSTFRGVCFSKAAVAGKKFEGRQCFNNEEVRNKKVQKYNRRKQFAPAFLVFVFFFFRFTH